MKDSMYYSKSAINSYRNIKTNLVRGLFLFNIDALIRITFDGFFV